jgi:uncharacterized protein YggE
MRRSRLIPVALVVLISVVAAGTVRAQNPNEPTGIHVTGQGRVTAQPDVAILNVSVSVLQPDPGPAFDRAAQVVASLTDMLKAAGVAERDIRTVSLSLNREFRFLPPANPGEPPPPPEFVGWRARYGLSIRLRDFSRIGRVVSDTVTVLGDSGELQGIGFTIEDTDALIDRARDAALQDARQKAERIADRLGVRLGIVTFVQETSAPPPTAQQPVPLATAAPVRTPTSAPIASAPISPGEQVLTVTVVVHYAIEPGPRT